MPTTPPKFLCAHSAVFLVRSNAEKLIDMNAIFTAFDFTKKTAEWAHKNLGGVVGIRLLKELKGESVNEMEKELTVKKMIATT